MKITPPLSRMKLPASWRTVAVLFLAIASFGATTSASAGIAGSGTVDITNGTFNFDSTGTSTVNPYNLLSAPENYFELQTGHFSYLNTLPANDRFFNYEATASAEFSTAAGGHFSFSQSTNLGYTTFNALAATPGGSALQGLFATVVSSVSGGTLYGSATLPTPSAVVPMVSFSWALDPSTLITAGPGASGDFTLWSGNDYSALPASLGLPPFPSSSSTIVNYTAHLALNAVPEPKTTWLVALGLALLAMGWRGKRQRAFLSTNSFTRSASRMF